MTVATVYTAARKRFGIVYPAEPTEFAVEIVPGKSVAIFRQKTKGVGPYELVNSFAMGDVAEYDSYNLSYTGRITGISHKCITITAYPGTLNEKRHMLKPYAFCWRNHDFDAAETAKRNAETSMYI